MFLPSNITLKLGDSGDFVAELQRRLAIVKCFSADQVNGFYDGPTVTGVMHFQGMNGLTADGVAGPETLRRLTGVIAGDSSGSSGGSAEEEEKQAIQAAQATGYVLAANQPDPQALWGPAAAPREDAPAAPTQSAAIEPAPAQAAAYQPMAEPSLVEMQARAEQIHHAAPAQDLASMLLAATAQSAVPPVEMQARTEQQHHHHATAQSQALQADPLLQSQHPQPAPHQPQTPREEPRPEPQGLIQKTMRFANAMMQKLADYFEAKLPPSVLSEVQQIGLSMAKQGLKEAPVPGGPELAGRGPELPTRGPEQQPGQQRG